MKFPSVKLYHKSTLASDHNSILLQFFTTKKERRAKRIFRFESMWLQDQRCKRVAVDAWQDGMVVRFPNSQLFGVMQAHVRGVECIRIWHVGREISQLQRQLEELEMQATSLSIIKALKETRVELNCWLEKEDSMWRQRSKLNWFRDGDRNTRFFHAKASFHF